MSADSPAEPFEIPEDTRWRQRRAADPFASAWVSANAGAGKTKVLSDRVIRLLLSGAHPGRILCLTFTRAAAAEMTTRVFTRLGRWVTLPDASLAGELHELSGQAPDRATIARARRLFARAIETPGGLKIETIHAFCERVLHLVPFEANVPAGFRVLDESEAGELSAAARDAVLGEATRVADGPIAIALAVVSAHGGGKLVEILDRATCDRRVPGEREAAELALVQLRIALDLGTDESVASLNQALLHGGIARCDWPALAVKLRRTAKPNDAKLAVDLEAAARATSDDAALASLKRVYFTDDGKGPPRKDVGTKGVDPSVKAQLEAERDRLAALRERVAAAETLERTAALYALAGAIRERREAAKAAAGALEFDDLIAKTLELLSREGTRDWVLYRLDRGIDHVLVDEAQDTNPDQWLILRALTREFTAGRGARDTERPRTLFAVGDPKQSIYSFQGADPRWFEDSRAHWKRLTVAAAIRFEDITLDLSFRSAQAVLDAVDHTFGVPAHLRGLTFNDAITRTAHYSARPKVPGRVEIWRTQEPEASDADEDAWADPVDQPEPGSPALLVAGRVAAAIKQWTKTGDESGRRLRPKDILVLARKRGPAFFAAIRALKAVGVAVAGADRFDIGEHIAVADLVAAGQAALLPENDLALAAALKSPLLGFGEDDLARVATKRTEGESLATALDRHAAGGDAVARQAADALASWRRDAAHCGPFAFFLGLLGPGDGRRRLVERLGHEAADAIDSFLIYAQTAESGPDTPSLTTFLARFEGADHTIKRDLDASGNEVRVMTVHGAKGLEAPVVVLLDGCDVHGPEPLFLPLATRNGEDVPVWAGSKTGECGAVASAREAHRARALEEHNRLLYVAMTRAKDRLVIAPFASGRNKPDCDEAWCQMVRRGLAATVGAEEVEGPHGPFLLWRGDNPISEGAIAYAAAKDGDDHGAVPAWLFEPSADDPEPAPPLRPSGVLGAADRIDGSSDAAAGGSRPEARRHGILVHDLLEHGGGLASADPAAAHRILERAAASMAPGLDDTAHARAVADTLAILHHPALRDLFGPGSRAEAPIVGTLADPASGIALPVSGRIDRLLIGPDEIVAADFKTGARSPGAPIPDGSLAQLALYRALLADAYPGRSIRMLLVWTGDRDPEIVEPSGAELDQALGASLVTTAARPAA